MNAVDCDIIINNSYFSDISYSSEKYPLLSFSKSTAIIDMSSFLNISTNQAIIDLQNSELTGSELIARDFHYYFIHGSFSLVVLKHSEFTNA